MSITNPYLFLFGLWIISNALLYPPIKWVVGRVIERQWPEIWYNETWCKWIAKRG